MVRSALTDDFFAQLTPYLELARDAGGEVFEAVGSDIAHKVSGGVVGLGVKSFVAVRRAVRTRFSRTRARQRLEKELAQATSDNDRAAAYRRCLEDDPSVGASLAALIERLDFLLALADACNELPVAMLGPPSSSLATVYVKPRLRAIGGADERNADVVFDAERFGDGSHIVYGTAGTEKSSLARWLTRHRINTLLGAEAALSIDQARLPIYVSARDLSGPNLANSLRTAVEAHLGARSLRPLSSDIFDIRAAHGHRQWVVVLDGIDEIEDVAQRDKLCRTIYDLKAREPDAFEFILFARPGNLPEPPHSFDRWEICPDRDPARLLDQYVEKPSERARLLNLLRRPEYRDIARVPLFIAIAAKLLNGIDDLPVRPDLLIEAFVANGIDTAARGDCNRGKAIGELLQQITLCDGSGTVLDAVRSNDALCKQMSVATSLLAISGDVERLLLATGLVELRTHRIRFIHRLIDRHFFARARAAIEEPSDDVWHKVDPIAEGAIVADLCVEWHRQGKPVEEAIARLADFGEPGRDVMLSLAVRLPDVPDAAFAAAFKSMLQELEDGEVTRDLADRLPALARTRASVRTRLAAIVEHSWVVSLGVV